MSGHLHMPPLGGATAWLNSEPLTPAELRGRVVLVNFWTWTCINWLRQEPYVRAWSEAYRDDGLVVVGVHTPEFPFEHEVEGVARAVEERGIDYPVAVDNRYEVWRAFDNHYWPALYFVDRDGRDPRPATSARAGTSSRSGSSRSCWVSSARRWWWRGWAWRRRRTGTTCAHRRPISAGLRGERRVRTQPPERLRLNEWTLTGAWATRAEHVALEAAGGGIACRFHARDAHLVMSGNGLAPIPFRVLLDGEAPGPSHGVDVDEDGNGVLRGGRMYQLVRQQGAIGRRTLTVTFQERGAEAYAFTFG